MSAGGGENEAKVVLTADPSAFVELIKNASRAFRELEQEGKKSFKEIDDQAKKFTAGVASLAKNVLTQVMGPALDPIKQALDGSLQNMRHWRTESTRLMSAAGEDWKTVGRQIDEVSRRTNRLPEDARGYVDMVRTLTGNWKTARDGAQDYSDLSRYLGRQSVSEMAPLASVMENMFGIRGQGRAQSFFDQAIRGAERLGQSGRLAVQGFEGLAPMLGMQTAAGPRGERFAKSAAAMIPALQKQGLSPEQAQTAVAQASSYFSGDLQGLQRQMRSAGILGKGQRLQDEYGRLNYDLPELVDMTSKLSARHARQLGGGDPLHRKLLQQNMPGLLAGAAYHSEELLRDTRTAMGATGASPTAAAAAAYNQSDEGVRMAGEMWLRQTMRDSVGGVRLSAQDLAVRTAGGVPNQSVAKPRSLVDRALGGVETYAPYAMAVPGLAQYAAGGYVVAGMARGAGEEVAAGRGLWGQGKGLNPDTIGHMDKPLVDIPALFNRLFRRDGAGGAPSGAGRGLSPAEQQAQAQLTAKAISQETLKVRLEMFTSTTPATSGGQKE